MLIAHEMTAHCSLLIACSSQTSIVARYATCDTLQALKRASLAGSITNLKWSRKLDRHLAIAHAHRDYYYIN